MNQSKPSSRTTRWYIDKLAAQLGDVSSSGVQRIWRKHGLRSRRLERRDLDKKLMRYVRRYGQGLKSLRQKCVNPARPAMFAAFESMLTTRRYHA